MPLKTKQVGIYTVSQMGVLESARLRNNQRNVAEDLKSDDPAMVDALSEWVLVAACTTPFIPRDEFFAMPMSELAPLIEAAEEMNSDLLPGAEVLPAKQAKKKQPKTT